MAQVGLAAAASITLLASWLNGTQYWSANHRRVFCQTSFDWRIKKHAGSAGMLF
jgi:hypothetical protein